jgi:hypothetical protein
VQRLRVRTPTTRCCTRRERDPVGVQDVMSRRAMEATDREGIRGMPTAILDPPEAGGVVASLRWIAGIVAREATRSASAGRSVPSREELRPEPDGPTGGIGSSRNTRKTPEKPEDL